MEQLHQLERRGYRFRLHLSVEYIKPDQRPPLDAQEQLDQLMTQRPDVIDYLAERQRRPEHIRVSEQHRQAIHSADTIEAAFAHALACVAAMTGDDVVYSQNVKRWSLAP